MDITIQFTNSTHATAVWVGHEVSEGETGYTYHPTVEGLLAYMADTAEGDGVVQFSQRIAKHKLLIPVQHIMSIEVVEA